MLDEIKDVFEKINRDRYIIGYDLNEQYAQVSYMRIDSNSPETVSSVLGEEEFNIPVAVCRQGGRFLVGKEAVESGEHLTCDLYEKAKAGETVFVDGEEYAASDLLLLFIQKSLYITPLMTTPEKIAGITITLRDADVSMIGLLKNLPELIRVSQDKLIIVSYEEAFHYYMAFQPGELQNHNVLLCDGTSKKLITYRLERNKFSNPPVVMVDKKLHPEIDFNSTAISDTQLDDRFLSLSKSLCDSRVYSGVYLIGEGFYGDWCKESIKFLCRGRRVFKGNNLFSKGACLAGRERVLSSGIDNKVKYLGNTNVKAEIGLKVLRMGVVNNIPLIEPSEQWFEVENSTEVLLRENPELEIYLKFMGNNAEKTALFKLDNLPLTGGRMTRVEVSVSMPNESKVAIKVRDLGFGEIFTSTGLEWIEEMELV